MPIIRRNDRKPAGSCIAPGARNLPAYVADLDPARLSAIIDTVCQHGASQTLGDPRQLDARGFEPLIEGGVRTLIAVPVHGTAANPQREAALLVMDELAVRVDPGAVNELELLMANAAVCSLRLTTMRQLEILADTDPLTGLRHLRAFTERLASADVGHTALLAIDIDNFKQVNDSLGHAAGDQLLVEVAAALRAVLRAGDEIFRVGGDEFVAVLGVPDAAEAARVADRLVVAACQRGQAISVGVALTRPGEPADSALRRADAAMYAAKQDDRSPVCLSK